MNLKNIIRSARGQKQVDLLLANARIINVFSGEIVSGNIAMAQGYIVGVGSYAAREFGTTLDDPFMTLSFLALPVIPELKITDKGLVDVARFKTVPLFVD